MIPPPSSPESCDDTLLLGIDIGGTFADFVALEPGTGRLETLKVLTTPEDPGRDVSEGLRALAGAGLSLRDIRRFVHGTTVGVNTVIQRRGARLALLTTAGFTDMLELARLRMRDTYNLFCERPPPLVPRERVFGIAERMGPAGESLLPPDPASVSAALERVRATACDGIVVSFLHAWRNPAHEIAVADLVRAAAPDLFVFCGSKVWPAIREYERTTTAVLNAYVHPRVARYLDRVEEEKTAAGIAAPLLLTTSAGGTMTARQGRRDCVGMLLSGTASGVVGAGLVARAAGERSVLTLDMGGTSADVAVLIDGAPALGSGQSVGEFPLAITAVEVSSSGQGGGSVAWVDGQGVLQVGPESAGSQPGPACFGRGGTRFAVTDAAMLCGLLGHGALGYGAIRPDRAAAESAARPLCEALRLAPEALAEGVLRVAISGMLVAIEQVLARAGLHASELTLLPFGGAGPMLGAMLADAAGMRRVLVPTSPGTLCALGALAAPIRRDEMRTVLLPLEAASWEAIQDGLAALERDAAGAVARMDASAAPVSHRAVDLRYRGQSFELAVPMADSPEALADAFHRAHERAFGHAEPGAPVQAVTLRVTATLPAPTISFPRLPPLPHGPQPSGHAPIRHAGAVHDAALFVRALLRPGAALAGPAVVTQPDCTVVVPPGWRAQVDGAGNLVLERR